MHADTERFTPPQPLAARIGAFAASLPEAFAQADGTFLAVGTQLGDAVGIFARLGELFAALRATLDDPELGRAAEALAGVGRDVGELAAALGDEESMLARLRALNGEAATHIDVIRRTIRAISMLAINAHISASDVDAVGEDVASFALRFKQLAGSARATVAASAAHSQRLAKALDAAQTRHAGFMLQHHRDLDMMAGQIEACVRAMDTRRAGAAEASRTIGAGSQQISADIGAVVMALQISDITRQRFDHVAEALSTAAQALDAGEGPANEGPAWAAGLSPEQLEAVAVGVCRLGEAQVEDAARGFGRELERAAASLRKLASEARDLVALGAQGYGSGRDGFAAFLAALQGELDQAVAVFRICQRHRAEVDARMATAAAALKDLLDQLGAIELIEEEIRLVSLNTAFLCQRIGSRGRVLATIAQELRGRAARLLEDVRRLSAVVEEIGGLATSFERTREARGAARMATMEQTVAAALEPLGRGGADLTAALARLGPEGTAVGETLLSSVATLGRLDDVGRTLRAMHRRIGRLADRGREQPGDEALRRERLRLFPVGYTMASERAIHAAVCGCAAAAPEAPAADDAADDASSTRCSEGCSGRSIKHPKSAPAPASSGAAQPLQPAEEGAEVIARPAWMKRCHGQQSAGERSRKDLPFEPERVAVLPDHEAHAGSIVAGAPDRAPVPYRKGVRMVHFQAGKVLEPEALADCPEEIVGFLARAERRPGTDTEALVEAPDRRHHTVSEKDRVGNGLRPHANDVERSGSRGKTAA